MIKSAKLYSLWLLLAFSMQLMGGEICGKCNSLKIKLRPDGRYVCMVCMDHEPSGQVDVQNDEVAESETDKPTTINCVVCLQPFSENADNEEMHCEAGGVDGDDDEENNAEKLSPNIHIVMPCCQQNVCQPCLGRWLGQSRECPHCRCEELDVGVVCVEPACKQVLLPGRMLQHLRSVHRESVEMNTDYLTFEPLPASGWERKMKRRWRCRDCRAVMPRCQIAEHCRTPHTVYACPCCRQMFCRQSALSAHLSEHHHRVCPFVNCQESDHGDPKQHPHCAMFVDQDEEDDDYQALSSMPYDYAATSAPIRAGSSRPSRSFSHRRTMSSQAAASTRAMSASSSMSTPMSALMRARTLSHASSLGGTYAVEEEEFGLTESAYEQPVDDGGDSQAPVEFWCSACGYHTHDMDEIIRHNKDVHGKGR